MHRTRHAPRFAGQVATLVAAAALTLSIAGCGGASRYRDDGWRYAMAAGLYYRPADLSTDVGRIQARLPELGATEGTWLEARMLSPRSRMPVPGPDDDVWHAVAVVGPETVARLIAVHPARPLAGEEADDDASLRRALLPPLREAAGSCPAGWVPVSVGSAESPASTAEGSDAIAMAVVCPGGDRVVVTTHDT